MAEGGNPKGVELRGCASESPRTEGTRLHCRLDGEASLNSAPERIRTSDLRLRRPSLYPAELRALGAPSLAQRGH